MKTKNKEAFNDFMQKYSPDHIANNYKGATIEEIENKCMTSDSPTLAEVGELYGDDAPVMWVQCQVMRIFEVCMFDYHGKEEEVCKQMASLICSCYPNMSVCRLLLYFYKFPSGAWGKVKPARIVQNLSAFSKFATIHKKHITCETTELRSLKSNGKSMARNYTHLDELLRSDVPVEKLIEDVSQTTINLAFKTEKALYNLLCLIRANKKNKSTI